MGNGRRKLSASITSPTHVIVASKKYKISVLSENGSSPTTRRITTNQCISILCEYFGVFREMGNFKLTVLAITATTTLVRHAAKQTRSGLLVEREFSCESKNVHENCRNRPSPYAD